MALSVALLQPCAMASEPSYVCGMEEHVHSASCYDADPLRDLFAADGLQPVEGGGVAAYVVHRHGDGCYDGNGALVCPLGDKAYLSGYPGVTVVDGTRENRTVPGIEVEHDPEFYIDGMPGGVRDQMDGGGDPGGIPVVVAGGTADGRLPICGKPEHTHGQACLVILTPASIAEALRLAGGTADVLIRQSVSGWTGDPSMAVYRVDVMDPDTGALVYSNVVGMPVSADGMSEYRLEDVVPAGSDVTVTSDWQGAGGALADCPGFYTCAGVPAGGTAIAEFGIGPDEDALANGTHGTGIVNPFHLDELSSGGPELPKTGGRGVSAPLAYGTAAVLAWAVMTWYRRKGGRDDA